jgi:hypothetical protein
MLNQRQSPARIIWREVFSILGGFFFREVATGGRRQEQGIRMKSSCKLDLVWFIDDECWIGCEISA